MAKTTLTETKFAAKVKREVSKLGTGPEARIEVKLRNKTKLKGYISEINADSFSVTDSATGVATSVVYSQVKTVKGHNLSTGAKIAIGVGVVAAIFLIIYVLLRTGAIQDD